jgi:hypothetical protein
MLTMVLGAAGAGTAEAVLVVAVPLCTPDGAVVAATVVAVGLETSVATAATGGCVVAPEDAVTAVAGAMRVETGGALAAVAVEVEVEPGGVIDVVGALAWDNGVDVGVAVTAPVALPVADEAPAEFEPEPSHPARAVSVAASATDQEKVRIDRDPRTEELGAS